MADYGDAVRAEFRKRIEELKHGQPVFHIVQVIAYMSTNDEARTALRTLDARMRELERAAQASDGPATAVSDAEREGKA